MAWDTTILGVSFRSTSGYVTDGTNQMCHLPADGQYPYSSRRPSNWSVNFPTLGWGTPDSRQWRDRSTSVDAKLAGCVFMDTAQTENFRLDLPAAGDYKVRLACGQATDVGTIKLAIKDGSGGSTLLSLDDTSIASGSFVDAAGAEYSAANWPGSNTPVTITFSGTVFWLEMTYDATHAPPILAHVELEQLVVAGNPWAAYAQQA